MKARSVGSRLEALLTHIGSELDLHAPVVIQMPVLEIYPAQARLIVELQIEFQPTFLKIIGKQRVFSEPVFSLSALKNRFRDFSRHKTAKVLRRIGAVSQLGNKFVEGEMV